MSQVSRDQVIFLRQVLRNDRDEVVNLSPKKTEVKSSRKHDSEDQNDDEKCTLEIDDSNDLDTLWRAASQPSQGLHHKDTRRANSAKHIYFND